jgi:hypothetical protein
MKKIDTSEKVDLNFFSPTLITSYAERALDFIYSIERFLYVLLPLLIVFAIVILFDIAAIKNYIQFFSDDVYDYLAVIFAFIIIGIISCLLKIIIDTRKKLDNWAYIFKKNSIRSSISISLSKLENTELLNAIIESVQEIGDPLQKYISNNDKRIERFVNHNYADMHFDMVIDDTRIDNNEDDNNYFKNKINEYGSIIVKVENSSTIIDSNYLQLFIQSILKYVKITNKFVGLALLVGNEVTNEAMELITNYSNKSIGYLIIIEKPVIIDRVH